MSVHKVLFLGGVFSIPEGLSIEEYHKYYEKWIKPYLSIVYSNQDFKFFFYISGTVFEYFQKYAQESLDLLKEFSDRGQIEILHGMYYDSAATLQSKIDQKDQLERLSDFISRNNLNKIASKGCWLTPSTYEHNIVPSIRDHEINYLIIDRAYLEPSPNLYEQGIVEVLGKHLKAISYDKIYDFSQEVISIKEIEDNLTQNTQNKTIVLLTIYTPPLDDKKFFYNMAHTLESMRAKDIDKFSGLPSLLFKKDNFIRTVCRIRSAPYGVDDYSSFSNYLTTRYESRTLYYYFLHILKKVSNYKKDKERGRAARKQLSKLQSHFAYWKYNDEWGIHNSCLRQHMYQSLGNIEENFETPAKRKSNITLLSTDYNTDGKNEVIINSSNLTTVLESEFGSVALLQRRQRKNKRWNYLSCYTPYTQPTHINTSFREMIMTKDADVASTHMEILNNKYPVSLVVYNSVTTNSAHSSVIYESHEKRPLRIEKQYVFTNNNFVIKYRMHDTEVHVNNAENSTLDIMLVVELNLSLRKHEKEHVECMFDNSSIAFDAIHKVQAKEVSFANYSQFVKMSIHTTNRDGMGVSVAPVVGADTVMGTTQYQHHSLLLYIPFSILPGAYETTDLQINLSNIKKMT